MIVDSGRQQGTLGAKLRPQTSLWLSSVSLLYGSSTTRMAPGTCCT